MHSLTDIYRAYVNVELANKAQYRANSLIWLIGLLIEPVVYLVVWANVARARGGSVGGFSAADFAAYYLVLLFVRQATIAPSPFRIARRIKDGEMNFMLLRPIHPMHADLVEINTQKLTSMPMLLVIAIGVGIAFGARLNPPWWSALAFVPALLIAGLLRFFFQYSLSAVAFWTDRIEAIWQAYIMLQAFLGGILAPLVLLPLPLRALADALPFRWVFSFPVDLMLGRLSALQTLTGFAIQIAWTLGSLMLLRLVWQRGIRRYGAYGG